MAVDRMRAGLAAGGLAAALLAGGPSGAVTITFSSPISETPQGVVERDRDGKPKVTQAGRTISVVAEAAAVNTSSGLDTKDDLAAVIGGALTGNVIDALAGLGALLASIGVDDKSATANPSYELVVSADKPVIKDVDFIVQGVFITQRVEGAIWTDTTYGDAAGQITFGGELADVSMTPGSVAGSTEQPTARLFSGTAHIDLDAPVDTALFSFTSVLNAFEAGGPRDSFSAAIITRWEATVSLVPLPPSGLMLIAGAGAFAALRRRPRAR